MKKGMRNFLSVIGAFALLAGIGVGVYYGNDTVHKWTDEQINKWKTDSSTSKDSSTSSETVVSSDGNLGIYLPNGHVFNKASVNATKSVIATLSPDDVSDKVLCWATSDATKVSIASNTTLSGGSQTLTLVSIFVGDVTITVTSRSTPSISSSFVVNVHNFVSNAQIEGLDYYTDTFHETLRGSSGTFLDDRGDTCFWSVDSNGISTFHSIDGGNVTWFLEFSVTTNTGDFTDITPSGNFTLSDYPYVRYQLPQTTSVALNTTSSFGEFAFPIITHAYVVPTSISGLSTVVFD